MEFRMANDDYIYTEQEFREYYGANMYGYKQWDHASKVSHMEKHKELLRRIRKGAANVRSGKLMLPIEIQSQITSFLYDATG